jgi:hypothetical protein
MLQPAQTASVDKQKILWLMLVIAVVVILLSAAGYFLMAKSKLGSTAGGYQAVFLSNGQVYFGKVANKDDNFVKLTDIYYLQLKQPLQNQNQDMLNQPDLTLIKLGNELHGPADMMEINRTQILFIEDLKKDSKVVQAIEKYRASK